MCVSLNLNLFGCHFPALAPFPVLVLSALSGAESPEGRLSATLPADIPELAPANIHLE